MAGDYDDAFMGTGKVATALRTLDWSECPIGPPHQWGTEIQMAVRLILDMATPAGAYLGDSLIYIPNDALLRSLDDKYPACLGRPLRESFPEVWDELEPIMSAVLFTGVSSQLQDARYELYRAGMTQEIYVNLTINPLRDARGHTFGVQTIAIETTERILAERRLACLHELASAMADAQRREEVCERAAKILTRSPDVPAALLYLVDDREERVRCVAEAGAARGCQADLQNVTLERERSLLGIAEAVATRQAQPFSGLERHCKTATQPLMGFTVPIVARSGDRVDGVLVAAVTPLRPREELREFFTLVAEQLATGLANARAKESARVQMAALAALDRAKTDFFSDVSHELRTPLTLLLAPLTDLLSSDTVSEHDRAQVALALRGAWRLKKLVRTLLDFARIEAGRAEVFYEEIDLAAYTEDVASMFGSAFAAARIAFVVDTPKLPERVFVDREMWEKIVLNLLSNALKFAREGAVHLRLEAEERDVVLAVSDTGCGIAPEHLPHVFDRFYSVQGSFARTQEGTGIGLSLVRELARLHGGRVHAESELERGTTIYVRVPRGSAHLPAERIVRTRHETDGMSAQLFREEALSWLDDPQLPTSRSAPLRERSTAPEPPSSDTTIASARILLADDDADMRAYLRRLLGERWEVTCVRDGHAALISAREQLPDLILSDVMMPGLDGFALLEALRSEPATAEIPVVLLSARAGEEATAHALRSGAADYIVKPFAAREVIARVKTQLVQAKLRQAERAAHQAERAAREAAEETNRAREWFLAMLAHELRSPLGVILGYVQLLLRDALDARASVAALRCIEQSARIQQRLVEDLLDVSRIVAGTLSVDVKEVETLTPQLESTIDALRLSAAEKGVQIECRLDPAAGPVLVDRDRLQQVLGNLLGNALKFTPRGGLVRVTCEKRSDVVELCVRDTGQGISPDALPRIFEQYWMGDRYAGRRGGLGLGLAIAKSIVTLHGGTLTAESDGEGRGAAFTVRLPLAPERGRTQREISVGHGPTSRNEPRGAMPGLGTAWWR